ncbi:hypothetical protein KPL71_023641 [Citrus sinensis]|uniref:Uncharacterized protein n=1 Tax=Citrus sinensis TaxID=2711 RepID=A0ACB8IKT2_CITSI|nr:hypothetical protein KPL71_023641 [Citrus sinensis]
MRLPTPIHEEVSTRDEGLPAHARGYPCPSRACFTHSRGIGIARPCTVGCEQRTLMGKDVDQACAGHAAGSREASCPRSRCRQRAFAGKPRTAPSRGTHSTRARPGLFIPVGTSLAGGGWEVAMPLSALLPLFHGGRILQLASVMRETTTGSDKRPTYFEGLDFLHERRTWDGGGCERALKRGREFVRLWRNRVGGLPRGQPPREKTQVHSDPWACALQGANLRRVPNKKRRKATLPLTIPRCVFKSSAKDSTRRSMGITIQGGRRGPSTAGAWPTTRASGDREGKTNLSHDGLNPAHVPYWWVNNPTLGEFCFTMIGRADIEGSKSNVAMNAWLPQASYPCGNFSDTSSFKFRRSKGSIGHAFTVRIRTENQNQTSFYPFLPHEISVLVELILGHLRYLLTDVPPQPNSPPDNVFHPDRPPRIPLVRTSSESTVRRPGKASERTVPSPSLGRHTVAARTVRRQPTGSGLGPPCPSLRANPFPEVTDPFCRLPLPTLFHRPEAVHLGDLMRL